MVTVEVELKEGDEEPEQHLDDGEHIERVVVPISELYEKLQGKLESLCLLNLQQEVVTVPV
jgi:ADP-ribose pyrophosphatase